MDNPITIATYTFPHEVLIDKSKLEAYGIIRIFQPTIPNQKSNVPIVVLVMLIA